MGVLIGSHKRAKVYKKTKGRCSICGSTECLMCSPFIPTWTRIVGVDEENLIPLCSNCNEEKGIDFLYLSSLIYLPSFQKKRLMLYYMENRLYLRKYVREFGEFRTDGVLSVEDTMLKLNSYDAYLQDKQLLTR